MVFAGIKKTQQSNNINYNKFVIIVIIVTLKLIIINSLMIHNHNNINDSKVNKNGSFRKKHIDIRKLNNSKL